EREPVENSGWRRAYQIDGNGDDNGRNRDQGRHPAHTIHRLPVSFDPRCIRMCVASGGRLLKNGCHGCTPFASITRRYASEVHIALQPHRLISRRESANTSASQPRPMSMWEPVARAMPQHELSLPLRERGWRG